MWVKTSRRRSLASEALESLWVWPGSKDVHYSTVPLLASDPILGPISSQNRLGMDKQLLRFLAVLYLSLLTHYPLSAGPQSPEKAS